MHGNQKGRKQVLSQTVYKKKKCASFAYADLATIEMNLLQKRIL